MRFKPRYRKELFTTTGIAFLKKHGKKSWHNPGDEDKHAVTATRADIVDVDFFEAIGYKPYKGNVDTDNTEVQWAFKKGVPTFCGAFSDCTAGFAAFPLIAGYAYHKDSWKNRDEQESGKLFEKE